MEMNFYAKKMRLTSTNYDTPHGLVNKCNYTTAQDQAMLVCECMKNEYFRRVVGTIEYETEAVRTPESHMPNVYTWKNSNKLLG